MYLIFPACQISPDRSYKFYILIPRKDRALKPMAYERTLSTVKNDRVLLSYNKNSISGVVFSVLCGFFNLQENDRRRRRTIAPRSKPFLYLTFVSP